jgi:hypothetical protein
VQRSPGDALAYPTTEDFERHQVRNEITQGDEPLRYYLEMRSAQARFRVRPMDYERQRRAEERPFTEARKHPGEQAAASYLK